jgi:hypothetical protein
MSFVHNLLLPFSRFIVVEVPGRGGVGSNSAGDNKVDKVSVLGLKLAGHIKGWVRMICQCCVLFLPRFQGKNEVSLSCQPVAILSFLVQAKLALAECLTRPRASLVKVLGMISRSSP